MFRLLQLAVLLLVSLAHGFSVQPGMLSVRGAAPACEMKLALRTNDMVKVISGDDKVSTATMLSEEPLRSMGQQTLQHPAETRRSRQFRVV